VAGLDGWVWDPTLYAGSAAHYRQGRMPYPEELPERLRVELDLGRGRLLDVGCGPGSLTLPLAHLFDEVVGVDPDPDMLGEARRVATEVGAANTRWVQLRAEDLPGGLGTFDVVTFAQSFHWMDRALVASRVFEMLQPGGTAIHVGAMTHRGVPGDDDLPAPAPPRDEIDSLVRSYLGPVRRAGQGLLPRDTPTGERAFFEAAGFEGPRQIDVGGGTVFDRSEDDVVASVYSLSSAAPHLFGARLGSFDTELRHLLRSVSPNGRFSERTREVSLALWRRRPS
jgi:SAM-dependent methyltransferase